MKEFIAVVTSVAVATSLLAAYGSNAVSIRTTAAAANEAASERETAGKEAEETKPGARTGGTASAQFQSSILFCGSTSLYPAPSSLASSFTEKYVTWDVTDSLLPDSSISVYVVPGGSGVGTSTTIDDTADFDVLVRDIKDSKIEVLGEHYQSFVVTKDAFTVSVNAENPTCSAMDGMPIETICRIFAGKIATQDQVDPALPAEAINVHIRDLSDSAYGVFQKSATGSSEVTTSTTQSASMTELATSIAGDKWGTGCAGFGAHNKANADRQVLTAMKVDRVEAAAENIISGAYTIQRPVMFVTGAEATPSEQMSIDYTFSQTGYGVVKASGYIPALTPEV